MDERPRISQKGEGALTLTSAILAKPAMGSHARSVVSLDLYGQGDRIYIRNSDQHKIKMVVLCQQERADRPSRKMREQYS